MLDGEGLAGSEMSALLQALAAEQEQVKEEGQEHRGPLSHEQPHPSVDECELDKKIEELRCRRAVVAEQIEMVQLRRRSLDISRANDKRFFVDKQYTNVLEERASKQSLVRQTQLRRNGIVRASTNEKQLKRRMEQMIQEIETKTQSLIACYSAPNLEQQQRDFDSDLRKLKATKATVYAHVIRLESEIDAVMKKVKRQEVEQDSLKSFLVEAQSWERAAADYRQSKLALQQARNQQRHLQQQLASKQKNAQEDNDDDDDKELNDESGFMTWD